MDQDKCFTAVMTAKILYACGGIQEEIDGLLRTYLGTAVLRESIPAALRRRCLQAEWVPPVESPIKTAEHLACVDLHQILFTSESNGDNTEERQEQDGLTVRGAYGSYGKIDSYPMACCAVDDAVRKVLILGSALSEVVLNLSFSFAEFDLSEPLTSDIKCRIGHFVRACKGIGAYSAHLGIPVDSIGYGAVTPQTKATEWHLNVAATASCKGGNNSGSRLQRPLQPSDWVYVVGTTKNELGGSVYAEAKKMSGGLVPRVDIDNAKRMYTHIAEGLRSGIATSCHTCSRGGLIAALKETATSAGVGMSLDLHSVPIEGLTTDTELLFSESAGRFLFTVAPENAKDFEEFMRDIPFGRIGRVSEELRLTMTGIHGESIMVEVVSPVHP